MRGVDSLKKKLTLPLESLSNILIFSFTESRLSSLIDLINKKASKALPDSKVRIAWEKSKAPYISSIIFEWFSSKERKINILYSSKAIDLAQAALKRAEGLKASFVGCVPAELRSDFSENPVKLILLFILSALLTNIALLAATGRFNALAFDSIVKAGIVAALLFEFRESIPLGEMVQTSAFKKYFSALFNKVV